MTLRHQLREEMESFEEWKGNVRGRVAQRLGVSGELVEAMYWNGVIALFVVAYLLFSVG